MPITKNVKHIFEPTPLQCGQAVLTMLTGKDISEIVVECGTSRETNLKQMKSVLLNNGISIDDKRREFKTKSDLPPVALLSLETPKCWHWSLFFNNKFYDPEYGLINEMPPANRKYYWELKNKTRTY